MFLFAFAVSAAAADQAPDFSLQGKDGHVYRLSDFRGKPLILFFFPFPCGNCEKGTAVMRELHKNSKGRYNTLGIVHTKDDLKYEWVDNGFPVAVGTKKTEDDYRVSAAPYFWFIGPEGDLKERFVGEDGAGMLKEWVRPGLKVGLFELSSNPGVYEGKTIKTVGRLIQTSATYFPEPVFMITNGADMIRVSSWLPIEVAPSPKGFKKQRKNVMSDFLDKYVIISGKVLVKDGRPFLEVKDAEVYDKEDH